MELPIEAHNSTPTVPLTDVQRVRLGELAAALTAARTQGYVEANVAMKLLELVGVIIPLFLKGV